MMNKRLVAVLTALLLILSVAGALGEGNYIDLKARSVDVGRDSEVLSCRFENSDYYCLIRPDGTKITDEVYRSIYDINGYPYFKVEVDSADGVHDEGLIDDQGNVIVPAEYADVSVVSDRWAYGVKLTLSSADEKDYTFTNFGTGDKSFYRIQAVDFYYRGTLAGTLSRSDFDGYPNAYGDYICVTARDKTRKYYNSKFEASPYKAEYSGEYSTEYKNRMTHYYHNGTGQEAFAAGCTLTPDEVEKSIVYENGAFRNLQGEEPFKAMQNYDSVQAFKDGYATVRMNSKEGLIDETGREIIPVEYEDVGNYSDHPLEYGVIEAKKDGKFGYLDAAGNVTCDFVYSSDIVRSYGPLATIKNLDGTTIVLSGLVGEMPEHYQSVDTAYNSRAFVAENEKKEHSLIDVSGEVLIPYTDISYIYYNRAATVAVCSLGNRTYRIYTFTRDDAVPAGPTGNESLPEGGAAENGTWTCSNGHEGITTKFCPDCGEARPADEIVCPTCGKHYPADSAPSFCPDDGTKLK